MIRLGPRRRPRRLAPLALLGALLLLAGCANIPTGGGVSQLTIDRSSGDAPLLSQPESPVKGASQQEILDGFIKAGRNSQASYSIARQYLTDDFRTTWNPNAGALVSSSPIDSTAVSTDELQLSVSVSASVDAEGRYSINDVPRTQVLQFRFAKDQHGQWRISSAPDGTVLTPNRFASIFHPYDLFFFDPSFQFLVPDRRWFADSTQVATRIVKALLAGPPDWLQGGVVSAFPAGTELTGAPTIDAARATVDLTSQVSSQPAAAKRRMTQQLTQSLGSLGSLTASITVGGFPVAVADGPEADRYETVLSDPVGFQKGVFGTLVNGAVRPLPGIGTAINRLAPVGAAVGRNGDQVAALSAAGVSIVRGTAPAVLLDARPGLAVPTMDPEGFTWSVPKDRPGSIIAYDAANKPHGVAFSLEGRLSSISLSRDGTRMLMAVQTSSGPKLLLAAVIRDKDLVPTALGQPTFLPIGGAPLLNASWASSSTVVALTQDGGAAAVTSYDLGGLRTSLGSVSGGVWVVGGNGSEGIRVLDSSGSVFEPSGSFGWQDTGLNASFLASQQ
ncbi:MAG TPA: LpqB family beta-propeller domain-containing protein [Pseudolysinimonas sp.]|nr:LpqB family beta-propeller domain-containing protein [Pseudolysinimonas sp.]